MRRFFPTILVAAASVIITLLVVNPQYVVGGSVRAASSPSEVSRQLDLFKDVFGFVRRDYVDEPDTKKMIETALKGMLNGLDPHSDYMDAKAFRDMQEQTRGAFGGLGIEITMEDGLVKVVSPIDDTPAAKAGILSGDLIVEIDGEEVRRLTLQQAVDKMRGPTNTPVKLTIVRKGQSDPIVKTLVREVIHTQSVKFRTEGNDVGYIRLSGFMETTTSGLNNAIVKLSTQVDQSKFKGYVLDLRNNPGGLLEESITVSSAFIESGDIVSIRGRGADEKEHFKARAWYFSELTRGKPVIVLINGGSASASEIVAGALQDTKRATILGTRSFGKGSVQTIIPLGSGFGALRLTTARYYTPSGRSIQAKGVVPEIEVVQDEPPEVKGKSDTKGEASLKGHIKIEGEEATGSQAYVPPKPEDDKALQMALELLRGTKTNPAFPPK